MNHGFDAANQIQARHLSDTVQLTAWQMKQREGNDELLNTLLTEPDQEKRKEITRDVYTLIQTQQMVLITSHLTTLCAQQKQANEQLVKLQNSTKLGFVSGVISTTVLFGVGVFYLNYLGK